MNNTREIQRINDAELASGVTVRPAPLPLSAAAAALPPRPQPVHPFA